MLKGVKTASSYVTKPEVVKVCIVAVDRKLRSKKKGMKSEDAAPVSDISPSTDARVRQQKQPVETYLNSLLGDRAKRCRVAMTWQTT